MSAKSLLLALASLALSTVHAQTPAVRSLLIDFGVNDGTNGNSTPSPDANGNAWNNIFNNTGVKDTFLLKDKQGQATGVKAKVGANFLTNGIATGGLTAPSAALLGEYAIATATQDYFFVQGTGSTSAATVRFSGLDKSKRYVFHVFGSRQTTAETRTSQYKFTGGNVSTITQTTTGPNVGANGYPGNNNTITQSDTVTADAAGGITFELSKVAGSYGYINLMRLDIVPGQTNTPAPVYYTFQNPGFELGSLAAWNTVGGSPGGATVGQAPTHASSSFAARLTGSSLRLEQQISYQATSGVSTYRLNGWFQNASTSTLGGTQAARLELLFYSSANALLGRFKSDSVQATTPTDTWVRLSAVGAVPAGTAFVKAAAVWRNAAGLATGDVYFDDLALEPYVAINANKMTYIGSSVPFGVGATGNRGYTTLYADLLTQRSAAGLGGPWVTANVCVPGNNTIDVTKRFDNDVFAQNGKYVFIGLSLGNEGITGSNKDATFAQFRDNMLALIRHARANGLVPVVGSNYGRNDYTATEYGYVQRINALLNSWAVPSVNLLGAVDDLNGRYTTGYWYDALHPNDAGHAEMAHAIVPSLLDALAAAKPQPRRRASAGITLRNSAAAPAPTVRLVPEDVAHPFTATLRFRTAGPGQLLQVLDSTGDKFGTIRVASTGKLLYTSAKGSAIAGAKVVSDNRWHKLVLTHYYARGLTLLYVDSTAEGTAAERLRPTRLDLGGSAAPARVQLRDFMFYRAGMNQGEVLTMAADSLLKSSLEIYAPLDGSRTVAVDSLTNLAQSLNILSRVASATTPLAARPSTRTADISLYPNPSTGLVQLRAPASLDGTVVQFFNALGQVVGTATVRQGSLDVSALPPGLYTLQFQLAGETVRQRLVRRVE
jgi:lysophospholipase L1-like esterase